MAQFSPSIMCVTCVSEYWFHGICALGTNSCSLPRAFSQNFSRSISMSTSEPFALSDRIFNQNVCWSCTSSTAICSKVSAGFGGGACDSGVLVSAAGADFSLRSRLLERASTGPAPLDVYSGRPMVRSNSPLCFGRPLAFELAVPRTYSGPLLLVAADVTH